MKKYSYALLALFLFFCLFSVQAQITAKWKLTGPVKFPTNKSGQINGIGRVSQVVFHPSNANILYAASASGGLFISTDAAQNWTVLGTDNLPDMSCASVCIDYTNDKVIYLGSGDANYYSTGYGIWKTTDGGKTWKQSNTGIGTKLIISLLMDPKNNNTIIAATNNGIWKSVDAGATWTAKKTGGDFKDMVFKPGSNKTMYAATSTDFFYSKDGGDTWNQVTMPASNTKGGRIGVTKADTNCVYVTFVGDFAGGKATPVYKSTNSGVSFTTVKAANAYNLNGYDETSDGQGNYNYTMTVDPLNANNVWIAGHCVFNSKDGGVTWKRMTSWAQVLHTDIHQLMYSPYDAKNFFCMNDGGAWKNTDNGVGSKWTPISEGLDCTENYHAAQSPIMKERIGAGTQDNGETYYDAGNWYTNRGGDWSETMAFDYQNANNIYYPSKGDRRTGLTGGSKTLSFPFTPDKKTILKFTTLKKNTAFLAAKDVWRTDNLTTDPPTWTKISSFNEDVKAMCISPDDANIVYVVATSGNIYRSDNALGASASFTKISTTPASVSSRGAITAIKSVPDVVYMSCGSKAYRSDDKGVTWKDITSGLPATNFIEILNDIASTDESVYIANGAGAVYYKNKKLTSWVNFSQGLPTICNVNDFMMYHDGGYTNSVLRVAYYGRGTWETPLYNTVTSIDKVTTAAPDFQIYPNPSTGDFTIDSKGYQHFEIYNAAGALIQLFSVTQEKTELNLTQQAKGLYIIKGITSGGKSISKKITVE